MPTIEWRCIQQPHYFLIVCKAGVFELAETIDRQRWIQSIDRCLLFKRAVANLTRNMEAVHTQHDIKQLDIGSRRLTAILGAMQ